MNRRKFFRFIGGAASAVVAFAAGISVTRPVFALWRRFENVEAVLPVEFSSMEVGTIEGVRWIESDTVDVADEPG